MRALSFSKGCYLGQEIVERIRSRGNVHRHLRHLELVGQEPAGQAPPAGTELLAHDGAVAGQIRSAAALILEAGQAGEAGKRIFALAMIRAEAEVREQTFSYSAGPASGTARLLAEPPSFQ